MLVWGELGEYKRVTDQPVVEVDHDPLAEAVLGDPLLKVLGATPPGELGRLLHLSFEHSYVLPGVIFGVIKQLRPILVL